MVVVIGCAGDECRARQEHRPRWVWLGLGKAVPLGRVDMSFIVAGCAFLLALLAGIVIDDIGVRRWQQARRDVPSFDVW
jgi:hypothetical protein